MVEYSYLVAYYYCTKYGKHVGNTNYTSEEEISTFKDILEIQDMISEKFDIPKGQVAILNYQFIGKIERDADES